jgi:hypothetical protein
MAVRGGADFNYLYVLVKIFGVNTFDWGPGVQWTWNPLGFRYGAYGGPGWSNFSEDPADDMDTLFMIHDTAYVSSSADLLEADLILRTGLLDLPNDDHDYWGSIYTGTWDDTNIPESFWPGGKVVKVSGFSLIGGRFSFRWHNMPYTEYARREALAGMGLMIFGRSLASIALQ